MERLTSRHNSRLKKWKSRLKEKSADFLLLSGEDLLNETIKSFIPEFLFSTTEGELQTWVDKYAKHPIQPTPYILTKELLQSLCQLRSFQGICAIGKVKSIPIPSYGRFLFLDGIQDPGNFGAIIRSCLAFDWNGIFYTPDCCSPYQQKVIRASRGGALQLPIQKRTVHNFIQQYPHDQIWITKKDGKSLDQFSWPSLTKTFVLVLGNEGHGPSSNWPIACPGIWIPIQKESLNVACAATLFLHTFNSRISPCIIGSSLA